MLSLLVRDVEEVNIVLMTFTCIRPSGLLVFLTRLSCLLISSRTISEKLNDAVADGGLLLSHGLSVGEEGETGVGAALVLAERPLCTELIGNPQLL